jgi:hypothetical protein
MAKRASAPTCGSPAAGSLPPTTCLYSAASTLFRSLSAASQHSVASKPRLAPVEFLACPARRESILGPYNLNPAVRISQMKALLGQPRLDVKHVHRHEIRPQMVMSDSQMVIRARLTI